MRDTLNGLMRKSPSVKMAFWTYYRQYGSFTAPGRNFRIADQPPATGEYFCKQEGKFNAETAVNFDVKLVKKLRERSGAPLAECLKALQGAKGDMEEALVVLRKHGIWRSREGRGPKES